MQKGLAVVPPASVESITAQAVDYISQSKAANTVRAYRKDWEDFVTWCQQNSTPPLPATSATVTLYLTHLAQTGYKASTLQRRISAISQAHKAAGHDSPTLTQTVRSLMAGIRRVHGSAQDGKAPVMTEELRLMVAVVSHSLLGKRDRAILLFGFAGAFRRSELVSLDHDDATFTREGIVVTLRRSKTDQEGEGRKVGIPYGSNPATCPVRAVQDWLEASGIEDGPLFRSVNRHGQMQSDRLTAQSVALVVKKYAEAAGLDPGKYSGHSLRAGLATSAAAAGVSERAIMNQTGHRSVNMVRRYIRDGNLFRENAAGGVGL